MGPLAAWLYLIGGAGGAWLLFWGGSRASQAGQKTRMVVGTLCGFTFVLAAASHFTGLQDHTYRFWLAVGGEDFVALQSVHLLLGLAFGWLTRKIQRLTVLVMAGILWLVLIIIVGSPLFWHYGGAASFGTLPDERGILKQRTPFTCAPAAASMLLHRYGVEATEGQLAQASRTALMFGTNDYALERAMKRFAAGRGVAVKMLVGSFEQSLRFPTPYIAGVTHPKWGSHEILVESFDENRAHLIDPHEGKREIVTHDQWRNMWQGRGIHAARERLHRGDR